MDLPRIELGALRLLSACDTTTPQARCLLTNPCIFKK